MRLCSTVLSIAMVTTLVSANAIAQRQNVNDICGYVDSDVIYLTFYFGHINQCLCQSTLSASFGAVDGILSQLGPTLTASVFSGLLNNSPNKQSCSYPDYSSPACVQANPCGFTCTDGFSLSANEQSCVCSGTGKMVCNGQCITSISCASAVSGSKSKRRVALKRAASHCAPHLSICAVTSSSGSMGRPWECVDGQNDLESCGGCIEPFNTESVALGVDCTAIEGASDVACHAGKCDVGRCGAGYTRSADRTTCEKLFQMPPKQQQSVMRSGDHLRNATRIL